MGGGSWSSATYTATTGAKISSGSSFGYHDRMSRARWSGGDVKAHESVDPKGKNKAGLNIRESRDSDEHPNSLPIIVGFDSTGSMGSVPRVAQKKLATLFKLLIDKGYAKDPQIAVATYGDATCDDVPLQFSQFESDNRIDDALDNLYLEGGGGGNNGETSNLLLYYAAAHTETDSFEKRGKKGHLFLIADEKQVPITASHIKEFIGDGQPLLEDLSFEGIAQAVTEKWNVWVLLIPNGAARIQKSREFYSNLFGADCVLDVENPDNMAETIAAVIGYAEGLDADTISDDLATASGKDVAVAVSRTMEHVSSKGGLTRTLR